MRKVGFTLVEMMIVVAIIAVLAAIAVPRFAKNYRKSQTTEAVRLMKQIVDAEAAFFATHGRYVGDNNSSTKGDISKSMNILGVSLNTQGFFSKFGLEVCGNKGIIVSSWVPSSTSGEPYKVYMYYPKDLNASAGNEDYYDGNVYLYDYINENPAGKEPKCN